ncbi:MAG: transporter ATP-binding protein [Paenibacillaceae bacterium]|jgi:ATP-binding cassette subfamily B protein/subfamily B ATP-binding cassette protein MsbA|nr:transporter ATP-binding protein [Paenibacillaceae bacterium]
MRNLRWIWPFIRNKKGWYAFGFLIMMVETAFSLGGTWIQQWIIDDVFLSGQFAQAVPYFLLLGLCVVSAPALFTATAMVHHKIGYDLRVTLGQYVVSHLFHLPLAAISRERHATFIDYISRDVYSVGETVSYQMPKGIQRVLSALVLMVIIGSISLPLLLTTTVLSIIHIMLGRHIGNLIRQNSRQAADKKTLLITHMEEGISGTREVVAYHREEWELTRFHRLFRSYYEEVMKSGSLENKQLLWTDPLKWVATLTVLGYGGYQVIQGEMSVGLLVVLWQYSSNLTEDYRQIFNYSMIGARLMGAIDRIRRITDIDPVADGDRTLCEPIRLIQMKEVSFTYEGDSGQPVLKQVTMEFHAGNKYAIVGASGGGKSTIAKLLVRFYEPDSGCVEVNGTALNVLDRESWAQKVCIVLQEPYFFPESIRTNLTMGREGINDEELLRLCKLMCIDELIASLPQGLDQEIGERGVMLSGGQKQRLSLVRALAGQPEVLILDEATSSLDLETERKVQRNLDILQQGRMTIIIAHRLSTVENADRIFVMGQGRVVEAGSHAELLARHGLYSNLLMEEETLAG